MPKKKQEMPDPKMYCTMMFFLVWLLIGMITFICLIVGGERIVVSEYPLISGGYLLVLVLLCLALALFRNDKSLILPSNDSEKNNPPTSS